MSLPERHYPEVGVPEIRPTLYAVPDVDQMTGQETLQPEVSHPEEEQPPAASTAVLGSLALAPHNAADNEIYERPFQLTKENFPGFYAYWYPRVVVMTARRMSPRERGINAQEDAAQLVFEGLITHYMGTGRYLELQPGGTPLGLLGVLARNKGVDHFRDVVRNDKTERAAIKHFVAKTSSAEEFALEKLEREENVQTVNSHLPKFEPGNQAMLLQASSGVPLIELAKQFGMEYGAFRVRLHRARQRLKRFIENAPNKAAAPQPRVPNKTSFGAMPQPRKSASTEVNDKPTLDTEPMQTGILDLAALASNLQYLDLAPKFSAAAATDPGATSRSPRARKSAAGLPAATPEESAILPDSISVYHNVGLPIPDPIYSSEASVGQHEALFAAVGLNPDEIDILTWSDVDGSSAADLGALLGKSEGAVDARLQRLRRRVREYVEHKTPQSEQE